MTLFYRDLYNYYSFDINHDFLFLTELKYINHRKMIDMCFPLEIFEICYDYLLLVSTFVPVFPSSYNL